MAIFKNEDYAFFSYSHKDSKKVVPIIKKLAEQQCRIWYDEALPHIEDYNDVIGNALKQSEMFVVFLTKNSVKSKYVRSEIYRACDLNKTICVVMLEKCKLPEGIALRLSEVNQIRRQDYTRSANFISKIAEALENAGCIGRKPVKSSAAASDNEMPYEYTTSVEGVTITRYLGENEEEIIPHEIDGEKVIAIDAAAFSDCCCLTEVTVPQGVVAIGNAAFSGCSSLTRVILPDSVTSIGAEAFRMCSRLVSITLPLGINEIPESLFSQCGALTSISIPNSVTAIGECAFGMCSSLTGIKLPAGVTSIGDSAFSLCSSLTSITMTESVAAIGESAFYGCNNLTIRCPKRSFAWSYCVKNKIPREKL